MALRRGTCGSKEGGSRKGTERRGHTASRDCSWTLCSRPQHLCPWTQLPINGGKVLDIQAPLTVVPVLKKPLGASGLDTRGKG